MKVNLIGIKRAKITDKGQIAIPKELRKERGFKVGSNVMIVAFNGRIEIMSQDGFHERFYPFLMSLPSLSEDWLSPEDEKAFKDLSKYKIS